MKNLFFLLFGLSLSLGSINAQDCKPSDDASLDKTLHWETREGNFEKHNGRYEGNSKEDFDYYKGLSKHIIDRLERTNDTNGLNILMIASAAGDLYAVKYLIGDGKGNAFNENHPSMEFYKKMLGSNNKFFAEWKEKESQFVTATTVEGYNALMYAVIGGHFEIVKTLAERIEKEQGSLKLKEYINTHNNFGWIPLHYAVTFDKTKDKNDEFKKTEREYIFMYLVRKGSTTNIKAKFDEGELDLFGMLVKYDQSNLMQIVRESYTQLWDENKERSIQSLYGTDKQIDNLVNKVDNSVNYTSGQTKVEAKLFEIDVKNHEIKDEVAKTCKGLKASIYHLNEITVKSAGYVDLTFDYDVTRDGSISNLRFTEQTVYRSYDAQSSNFYLNAELKRRNIDPVKVLSSDYQGKDLLDRAKTISSLSYNPLSKNYAYILFDLFIDGLDKSDKSRVMYGVLKVDKDCNIEVAATTKSLGAGLSNIIDNLQLEHREPCEYLRTSW